MVHPFQRPVETLVVSKVVHQEREKIMKRALVLTIAVGLLGSAVVLQAGHKRRCCGYSTYYPAASYQSAPATYSATTVAPQATVANSNGTTYRSYSYDPQPVSNSGVFTYTTESTGYRDNDSTRTKPSYLYPKTDPRRYTGGY